MTVPRNRKPAFSRACPRVGTARIPTVMAADKGDSSSSQKPAYNAETTAIQTRMTNADEANGTPAKCRGGSAAVRLIVSTPALRPSTWQIPMSQVRAFGVSFALRRDCRRQGKATHQTQMLEERVGGGKAFGALHGPEVVRHQSGDPCQNAEAAGGQPNQATPYQQDGSTEFDDDGRDRPEPSGLKSKMRLLRDRPWKIDRLVQAADQIRRSDDKPRPDPAPLPSQHAP